MLTVVSFIAVMGVIVFVHELGHLLAAKRNGIIVEEFGLGYPPRLIKLFERGGTVYSLNVIPFGGFARMRGEDDPKEPGSFAAASRLARITTLIAGPAMNFLLALILFAVASFITGVPDPRFPGALVTAISPGSPAEAAQLMVGDRLISVNDQPVVVVEDLRELTSRTLDQPARYRLVRSDPQTGAQQELEVMITPLSSRTREEGALGIGITEVLKKPAVWQAAWSGVKETGRIIYLTFSVPATLIREGRPISDAGFLGPVGIAATTGDVVEIAITRRSAELVIWFMALLSAALGITNLLPLPALDGGRLLFIAVEVVRGRRIEPAREGMVHLIGFGLLLLLIGLLTVREIGALINGTFPSLGIR